MHTKSRGTIAVPPDRLQRPETSHNNRPTVCLTLDLESDYATDGFDALGSTGRLAEYCRRNGIPLTVFAEGRVLRNFPDVLEQFPSNTEFQLHCNDHRNVPDTPAALSSAVDAYQRVFGHAPTGYRAANYRMTADLLNALQSHHFVWDASCLPIEKSSYSWPSNDGKPFSLSGGLWELPVSVTPSLGIPVTMSMVSLVGLPLFWRLLRSGEVNGDLVFVFHLHDLFPTRSLRQATIKRILGHSWNYRFFLSDPFERFTRFVDRLQMVGYEFLTCSQWLRNCTPDFQSIAC